MAVHCTIKGRPPDCDPSSMIACVLPVRPCDVPAIKANQWDSPVCPLNLTHDSRTIHARAHPYGERERERERERKERERARKRERERERERECEIAHHLRPRLAAGHTYRTCHTWCRLQPIPPTSTAIVNRTLGGSNTLATKGTAINCARLRT